MSEEHKLLHRLSIDLHRSLSDIKENMLWSEFIQWGLYYKEEVNIHTLSMQLSQLTELIYKSNFDGDVTIYDFIPNASDKQKDDARIQLRKKKIEMEIMEKL